MQAMKMQTALKWRHEESRKNSDELWTRLTSNRVSVKVGVLFEIAQWLDDQLLLRGSLQTWTTCPKTLIGDGKLHNYRITQMLDTFQRFKCSRDSSKSLRRENSERFVLAKNTREFTEDLKELEGGEIWIPWLGSDDWSELLSEQRAYIENCMKISLPGTRARPG